METNIGGQVFEIQEQVARRIQTLRIGDRVRVLHKPAYSDPKVYTGVVIGFEPFPSLPSVIVAYVESEYSSVKVKTAIFNEKTTKEFELVAAATGSEPFDLDEAMRLLDRKVAEAEREAAKARDERDFFVKHWGGLVSQAQAAVTTQANEANDDLPY